MKILIDTHFLLWSLFEPGKLNKREKRLLKSVKNDVYVSAISFYEIAIKYSLNKLTLAGVKPSDLPELTKKMDFCLLALSPREAACYYELGITSHSDPFDKMLITQAIKNDYYLMTRDGQIINEYRHTGLKIV